MSTLETIRQATGLIPACEYSTESTGLRLGSLDPLMDNRVHEAEGATARMLALIMAGHQSRPIFWIAENDKARFLRARALTPIIDPDKLICVEVANRKEGLWAAEEALRCRGAGLAIFQTTKGPDLQESRRLQLAAQSGQTMGLVVIERRAQSSAAQTRWRCDPVPDRDSRSAEPSSHYDWLWSLTKNKQGRLGEWRVRGDPDPSQTLPPDLRPMHAPGFDAQTQDLHHPPNDDRFQITTLPRPVVSAAAARPLAPA